MEEPASTFSHHSHPHTFLLILLILLIPPFPSTYFPTYALTYLIIFYLSLPTYAYFCDHPPSCTNPLLILSYLCAYLSYNSLSYLQFSTPYPPLTSHLCLHLIIHYSPTFCRTPIEGPTLKRHFGSSLVLLVSLRSEFIGEL